MMSRRAFVLLSLAIGCSRGDHAVDPVWGKQACAGCGMIVENRRTAAQVLGTDGDRLFFDDAGCMVLWLSKHAAAHTWVKDAERGDWIDANTARWNAGASTPMDFGWEASGTHGEPWDTMRDAVVRREGSTR